MQQEQIKAILVNILTAAVIVGVLIVGYVVFIKQAVPVVSTASSVAKIAEETALIGTEIDTTVRDLGDLSSAIANSAVVLDLPAFKNLQDFTVQIPYQDVGRQNPFVPVSAFSQLVYQNTNTQVTSTSQQNAGTTNSVPTPAKTTGKTTSSPVANPVVTPVVTPEPAFPASTTPPAATAPTPVSTTPSVPVLIPPALPNSGI